MNQEYRKKYKLIYENLAKIGLSKSEQDMYVAFMDIGSPQPVAFFSYELEIPRQTANSILRNMTKKGIIVKTRQNSMAHFHTNEEQISKYIDGLCQRLQDAKIALTSFSIQ